MRLRIADGFARAVRDAETSNPGFTAAIRPNRLEVEASRTALTSVERRLRAPEPVASRGMVMLRALLTEPDSPLYQPNEPGALGSHLRAAAAALER
jgi:hypothetical protein